MLSNAKLWKILDRAGDISAWIVLALVAAILCRALMPVDQPAGYKLPSYAKITLRVPQ